MTESFIALLTTGSAILLGAMSPGPSFIMIARTAVVSSRRCALVAAAGMGTGCMIFSVLALAGLHSLLVLVPWLYSALKIAGGAYLLWLGVILLFSSDKKDSILQNDSQAIYVPHAFLSGMLTQLSNPNTAIVFGSIFAATLGSHISPVLYLVLPLMAFCIDTLWYALVACLLSADGPRRVYISYKRWLDRIGGSVMCLLGIRLFIR
ncbi:LysE family transporter [Pantoea agglomerans]|uniref:LysE family translocator n=1 Tax=Enterobacter agglomerans TaxID=549 RepID=UPI0013C0B0C9|nr:LysE family transporter [Pantoea agglomerans]NEH20510.1 LysE family transporter [Pantoea agglomerans]